MSEVFSIYDNNKFTSVNESDILTSYELLDQSGKVMASLILVIDQISQNESLRLGGIYDGMVIRESVEVRAKFKGQGVANYILELGDQSDFVQGSGLPRLFFAMGNAQFNSFLMTRDIIQRDGNLTLYRP